MTQRAWNPIDATTRARLQHFPGAGEDAGHPEGQNNGDEDGKIAERVHEQPLNCESVALLGWPRHQVLSFETDKLPVALDARKIHPPLCPCHPEGTGVNESA